MKVLGRLLFFFAVVFGSCDELQNAAANDKEASSNQVNNLKVGGLYLVQNKDSTYYLTKILVIDDFAIHLRTYHDTFKAKPNDINSDNLKVLIGHAPLDKNGFLIDKPELLKVEEVKESELEGYKVYLESMSGQ